MEKKILLMFLLFLSLSNCRGQTVTGTTINDGFYVQSKRMSGTIVTTFASAGTILDLLVKCVELCRLVGILIFFKKSYELMFDYKGNKLYWMAAICLDVYIL
jgi:hypothetical protein